MMQINIPYYEDNNRYSNSNIGQYIKYGPMYLRRYLDKQEEGLSASFLAKGTMIHMYILQPEDFWKEYTILDYEIPKIAQQKLLCSEYCFEIKTNPLESQEDILLRCYNKAYSNSKSNITKIQEAKDVIEKYDTFIQYGTMDKKAISFADVQMLKQIKKNLEEHKLGKELFFNLPSHVEVYNEFHINWEYPQKFYDIHLPCKSLLDRVHIDTVNKVITLIDLKTTSNLYEFEHSMETYDYCRQFEYYHLALDWYIKNEREIDLSEYTKKTYVVAISTSGTYEVRIFDITDNQVNSRLTIINDIIENIAWHHVNDKWQYKKEYYEGNGSEQLKI